MAVNQFRTNLLNLKYEQEGEHIPKSFNGKQLGGYIRHIHNVLFPLNVSREYKLFLAYVYLQVIASTDFNYIVTEDDPRITYDLNDFNYFKINRFSVPHYSDDSFLLQLSGELLPNITGEVSDTFVIKQFGDSNYVSVYSVNKGKWLFNGKEYSIEAAAPVRLDFDGETSKPVRISNTGIEFAISGGSRFNSTSHKQWSFTVEAPYSLNVYDIYSELKNLPIVNELFNDKTIDNIAQWRRLWLSHPNYLYKLTGLLIATYKKINSL